ncbi:MAG: hypothetical protein LBL93_06260 [Ruminococcus sp.]|jgi:hypothetical protein|nr:hypothetical protein [Ruminococcus sp.]
MKRKIALLTAFLLTATTGSMISTTAEFTPEIQKIVSISVDFDGSDGTKEISPYIYGINDFPLMYGAVDAGALRQGGNRYSGYNWENNFSSAGSDWVHSSDNHLFRPDLGMPDEISSAPGAPSVFLDYLAEENDIPYTVATLQMAGYVAADGNGTVTETEIAPSARWKEVIAEKGSEFSLTPDTTDDYVYMDEYVNYLVNKLGDSQNGGISAYSLDNEPALWSGTHARMHPEQATGTELVSKSVALAKAVKNVDPNAEVIGGVLFGVWPMNSFNDADDYGDHSWFSSYFLDEMKKASDEAGTRLMDVYDFHYYTEAQCTDGHRVNFDAGSATCEACKVARVQSARTLYDDTYKNDNWNGTINAGETSEINKWVWPHLPLLPNVQSDIDTYNPGTKMAITEYNFGGNNTSATIAQADALGAFAKEGLYLANYWVEGTAADQYIVAGMNLLRNYDGEGGQVGDEMLNSETSDIELSYSHAYLDKENDEVAVSVSNKTMDEYVAYEIQGATLEYDTAKIYGVTGDSPEIQLIQETDLSAIDQPNYTFTLDPMTAAMVVFSNEGEGGGSDPTTGLCGDVDLDEDVRISDLVALCKHIVGVSGATLTGQALANSDCDGDGNVDGDAEDALVLAQYIVKKISSLPHATA